MRNLAKQNLIGIITLLIINFSLITSNGQTVSWVKIYGDSGDDFSYQCASDSVGNIYFLGGFIGQLIIGNDTLISHNLTSPSFFVTKTDITGNDIWALLLPTTYNWPGTNLSSESIKIGTDGNLFVSGNINLNGGNVNYLAKINSNGYVEWHLESPGGATLEDIHVDENLELGIIGTFSYSVSNGVLMGLSDSVGLPKWINYTYPNPEIDGPYGVYTDSSFVYFFGQYKAQIQFTDSFGTVPITLNSSHGLNDWDFFIAKYNKTGQLISASTNAGLTNSPATSEFEFGFCFSEDGNLYLGSFPSSSTFKLSVLDLELNLLKTDSITGSFGDFSSAFYLGCKIVRNDSLQTTLVSMCDRLINSNIKIYLFDNNLNMISVASYQQLMTQMIVQQNVGVSFGPSGSYFACARFENSRVLSPQVTIVSTQSSPDAFLAKYDYSTTNLNQITTNAEIIIYPNPFKNSFQLSCKKSLKNAKMQIINLMGQPLHVSENLNGEKVTIELEDLPRGTYLVRVISNEETFTKRVVIH